MNSPATKMEFHVRTTRIDAQAGRATCKDATITLDTAMADRKEAFNPAELLLAALGACLQKGIGCVTPMLKFELRGIDIRLHAVRKDVPPRPQSIDYQITVDSDEPERRLELLRENVKKYCTVFNTIAPGTQSSGTLSRASPTRYSN